MKALKLPARVRLIVAKVLAWNFPLGNAANGTVFRAFDIGDFQGGGRRRGPDAPSLDRRVSDPDSLEKI